MNNRRIEKVGRLYNVIEDVPGRDETVINSITRDLAEDFVKTGQRIVEGERKGLWNIIEHHGPYTKIVAQSLTQDLAEEICTGSRKSPNLR